ncbi:MAG: tyrosine--tRNA ligase [Patescibacteria group bacterium]|nr:tyrosine--tRNA ligase [Patescibacteria group bacterium]
MTKRQKINHLLEHNVVDIIDKKHLEKNLLSAKKLRVKHGIDPTGKNIHIGRAVVLWKLREFQELGHKIILIIGDFTAQIGDPSDKLAKRPFLDEHEIKQNMKNYLSQIGKILDLSKCEIHHNSKWLKKLNFKDISKLADIFTIQQMLERRNFAERFKNNQEISLRETLYPIMQGYDSVAVKADLELGGADQLFNLHAGRKIQEFFGQKPQDILTTKMLLGLDGRKMSTSWGNVININDSPDEQYGKIMSMRDEMIPEYLTITTNLPESKINELLKLFQEQKINPKEIKKIIAFNIVNLYWGKTAAQKAENNFEKLFVKKEITEDIPILKIKKSENMAIDVVLLSRVVKSKSEAWRLILQGGLKINNQKIEDPKKVINLKNNDIIKIGKHQFFKISF